MNVDATQTTFTQGPSGSNQIVHVRQDSASELNALFSSVMNPNFKTKIRPMKSRNLPKSFFQEPDRPRPTGPYRHGHSQSMSALSMAATAQINHSRSSSSDSNASHASPAALTPNANNCSNNPAGVSQGMATGTPMNGNMKPKLGFPMSPAHRRVVAHNQFANRNHAGLQISQVAHSRSKSSPASFQLLDVANLQVKPSDIPIDMPLPSGWSATKTPDGQHYFMNHNDRSTTWEDPRILIIKQRRQNQAAAMQNQSLVSGSRYPQQDMHINNSNGNPHNEMSMEPLPPGWEQATTPQGEIYFMNHQTRSTSWTDPRLQNLQQNNGQQSNNNSQLQQQVMKVNQMDMAGSQSRPTGGMMPQQQSMLKHLVQEKEMHVRRQQLLKQPMSSSGMDPFLGGSNSNFHQRDASLDSGVGMGSTYNLPRTPEDFLTGVPGPLDEMDTGDLSRRLHGPQHTQHHMMSNQQHTHVGNVHRFPNFIDSLSSNGVDFSNGGNRGNLNVVQTCPNSVGSALDGGDLMPTFPDTLVHGLEGVDIALDYVKSEDGDNMVWI